MDISDFTDNYRYKTIIPITYVVSWLLMGVGSWVFAVEYQVFAVVGLIYLACKSALAFVYTLIGAVKGHILLNEMSSEVEPYLSQDSIKEELLDWNVYHAFIIPNYKEEEELLAETIQKLADHGYAKDRYLVFLAMEEHEMNSQEKAKRLIEQFQSKFKIIGFTKHVLREHEQKGKASNVSWCAEHLEETFFNKFNIPIERICLTIIDADSWIPELYIREVDNHILTHPETRQTTIYQPCQIFTRNHTDVPIITRTFDQLHSMMHLSNLYSVFDAAFPLSNYSFAFLLAKRIGFWDTCPDAIGEDFHTTIKAFWKTDGEVRTHPIYVSFNQVNIQTGNGYFADMSARFWQAERHGRGVADVAYCCKMLSTRPIGFRTLFISYQALQCFFLPAIIPWIFLGLTIQDIVYHHFLPSPEFIIPSNYISWLFDLCSFSFIGSYVLYWSLKRRTTVQLYSLELQSWLRIIQFPLLIIPNLLGLGVPAFLIAAFKVLIGRNEYEVAKKSLNRTQVQLAQSNLT